MKVPNIKMPLPGPKAKAMVERDERFTAPAYGRVYPLVVKQGHGCVIEDVDGNLFLDFMAGIAVANTGHAHPRVVKAIEEQARKFLHICGSDFYYEPMVELAEKLAALAPGQGGKKVFFTNSGTETVEAAFKLARYHTKRQHVIAFYGAFHGRSMGSLSLTASRSSHRAHFGPLIPGVHHVPYGFCHRCPYQLKYGTCGIECVNVLEKVVFRHEVAPEEVAAIFVEPVQGEGGYIVPPPEFLPMLKELCQRHGILLIADEIQSGFGRTGKMFACEHWGIEPDILCAAKGIASGMPLGRHDRARRDQHLDAQALMAAPSAAIRWRAPRRWRRSSFIEDGLVENAGESRRYLKDRSNQVASNGIRASATCAAWAHDRCRVCAAERAPAGCQNPRSGHAKCFERGLLLLSCGESTLRFCPPLVVTEKEAATAVEIFEAPVSAIY